jgi:hypothetical protein
LVAPAAWESEGAAFALVLHRCDDGTFNVAIVNWGHGLEWHPARLHPATGGVQRTPAIDLRGVPRERLTDSGFWFVMYRMLFIQHATPTGPSLLYDTLLPALVDQPTLAGVAGAAPSSLRWHDPPLSHDASHAALAMASLEALLCARGLSAAQARYLGLLVRWSAVRQCVEQLSALPSLSASDAVLLRLACSHTAAAAASLADAPGALPFATAHAAGLRATLESLEALVSERRARLALAAPPPIELERGHSLVGAASFPLFGRLRRGGSIDHLAGESEVPPVVLPVELSRVADKVETLHEVAVALRHTVQLCEVLSNQMRHVSNTYLLRIALIQHLVTAVLPLPLPHDHPQRTSKCFWASQEMRYETQADLLRLLSMVCRHFAACCFSIRVTRSFDATRLVVVACLATLADAVMRVRTCDVPSLLCDSYSGQCAGPGGPFGFEIGAFAVESEDLQLSAPELHIARTKVLDYFAAQRARVPASRVVFRFEGSMDLSEGDATLLRQLCLHTAFPIERAAPGDLLPLYLTGEDRLVLENYPELGFFRDIVFIFKLLMVPSVEALPEIMTWRPLDAALSWRYQPGEGFVVSGFRRHLSPAALQKQVKDEGQDSWLSRLGRRLVGLADKPRAPPSSADPAALLRAELGDELKLSTREGERTSEDDILHLPKLPSFDGALRPRESELLLQYLTVPYLRVPLLLRFFSSASHVHALGNPKLQAALDAALFEPGLWQSEALKQPPQQIPAPTRAHLATPAGILFNELTRSPAAVGDSILALTGLALELDGGRYDPASANCAASLYILRVAARVDGFIRAVLLANEPEDLLRPKAGSGAPARGLLCGPEALSVLRSVRGRLVTALRREMATMVEAWCDQCLAQRQLSACCTLFAHLAFCYKHVEEAELEYDGVSILLCAQVFLGNNHAFDVDVAADLGGGKGAKRSVWEAGAVDAILGLPQTEVFELFTRHRCKLLRWLERHPTLKNHAMEAIVRTVTCTGPRRLPGSGGRAAGSSAAAAAAAWLKPRVWTERPGYRGMGRFVPDTSGISADDSDASEGGEIDRVLAEQKAAAERLQAENKDEVSMGRKRDHENLRNHAPGARATVRLVTQIRDCSVSSRMQGLTTAPLPSPQVRLETWLRLVTATRRGADVEVNLQLGEFSLRRQALTPLPKEVARQPDFLAAFGEDLGPIQSVQVSATSQRRWLRLVGERHDLQRWAADLRPPPRPGGLRPYPSGLRPREAWLKTALEEAGESHLAGMVLTLPDDDLSDSSYAILYAQTSSAISAVAAAVERSNGVDVSASGGGGGASAGGAGAGGTGGAGAGAASASVGGGGTLDGHSLKEVMILRDPPTIHVYDVVECGRRHFRSIVFSSDATHCLHALYPRRQEQRATSHVQRVMGIAHLPVMPQPSLVITRTLSAALGEQTYLPARLLYGLLPTALLEMYDLWQQADDKHLRGYMKPGAHANDSRRTELRITLGEVHVGGKRGASGDASALIQRIHLLEDADVAARKGESPPSPARASAAAYRHEGVSGDGGGGLGGAGGKAAHVNPIHAAAAAAAAAAQGIEDEHRPTLSLLNLLLPPKASPLRRLSRLLSRLEDLSHLLVWSRANTAGTGKGLGPNAIELIELPRLRLSFRARAEDGSPPPPGEGAGELRLFCEQHEGLFISNRRSAEVLRLLQGVPNSLLLEHLTGGLFVLVSAGTRPKRVALADGAPTAAADAGAEADKDAKKGSAGAAAQLAQLAQLGSFFTGGALAGGSGGGGAGASDEALLQPFPSELELECGNEVWLGNLGATRHYLYPVHLSERCLFAPTLAAALYLLMLRLLARQYDAVVAMASLCVCDGPLSPEERQIVRLLAQCNADRHPDAHACRLHVSLHAMHTPLASLLPWDLARELKAYVHKRWHVALSCRLEVAQELLLLTHISAESVSDEALAEEGAPAAAGPSSKSMDRTLRNRRLLLEAAMQMDVSEPPPAPPTGGGLLGGIGQAIAGATQAILGGGPTSPPNTIQLPCPAPTVGAQFDTLQDRSCVDEGVLVEMGKFFSKISKISYSKPEALVGLPALKELDRWLSHGLELHGGRDDKGFLFLYELIRGDLVFKLLANDTGHALGAVLMRLLPTSDTCKPGFLMSVLRVLLHNPQVKSPPPSPSPLPPPPSPLGRCWREAARTRRDETQVIQISQDSAETQ